jgi:RsiW-degrading membrane proteinase PrsW (M82 family)
MTGFEYILIALSFLIGLWCIRYVRSYDVHEQEPFSAMLFVTVFGGIMSVAISLFLYRMLHEQGVSLHEGFPFTYFYVGFIEELAKLAALFLCWPVIRRQMDEPTDGPIYIACVALGFSLIENYFYALAQPQITFLIAIRLIICTPMHIAFSLFMGLAFFWAMRLKGGWSVLVAAYFVASIYHALYDILVTTPYLLPNLSPVVMGFFILLPGLFLILKSAWHWMHLLLGYTATQSPFRRSLAEFIHDSPSAIEPGMECIDCGNAEPKPTCERGRIRIQRCETCGAYLCSPRSLRHIVHHHGSLFGSLKKRIRRPSRHIRVLIDGNRIDRKKRVACFRLDEFNRVLEKTSRDLAARLERKWWFPFKAES